jgi:hypothetical protein
MIILFLLEDIELTYKPNTTIKHIGKNSNNSNNSFSCSKTSKAHLINEVTKLAIKDFYANMSCPYAWLHT